LRVTLVGGAVTTAVAQVDAADECDIEFGSLGMAQHDEFLMMRATGPNAHVPDALPTGPVNVLSEMTVLLFAERQPIKMGPPDQAFHDYTPPRGLAEHARYLGVRAVQQLVGITSPVGEEQQIVGSHESNTSKKFGKVDLSVDERGGVVAAGPCLPTSRVAVQPSPVVAPLVSAEKPPFDPHVAHLTPDPELLAACEIG
jgi:hypothetical protein